MRCIFADVQRDAPDAVGSLELLDDFGARHVTHLQVVNCANVVAWFRVSSGGTTPMAVKAQRFPRAEIGLGPCGRFKPCDWLLLWLCGAW